MVLDEKEFCKLLIKSLVKLYGNNNAVAKKLGISHITVAKVIKGGDIIWRNVEKILSSYKNLQKEISDILKLSF